MSSDTEMHCARLPKRARGKQRVAALLQAAAAVFAEKGYEAATMTEIAARAGAPIGSLYQFFPVKEALADTLGAELRRVARCRPDGSSSRTPAGIDSQDARQGPLRLAARTSA